MTPEENAAMRQRTAEYDAAQHALNRYGHLRAAIEGLLNAADHDLSAIVIDVVKGHFEYRTKRDHLNIGSERKICHLTAGEHDELHQSFLEWARSEIDDRIAVARARMEDA